MCQIKSRLLHFMPPSKQNMLIGTMLLATTIKSVCLITLLFGVLADVGIPHKIISTLRIANAELTVTKLLAINLGQFRLHQSQVTQLSQCTLHKVTTSLRYTGTCLSRHNRHSLVNQM